VELSGDEVRPPERAINARIGKLLNQKSMPTGELNRQDQAHVTIHYRYRRPLSPFQAMIFK
jgi:hypothetical protein